MAGRHDSLEFTDPATGANLSYVGKRTIGTEPLNQSLDP
jgi:hypothetical protein